MLPGNDDPPAHRARRPTGPYASHTPWMAFPNERSVTTILFAECTPPLVTIMRLFQRMTTWPLLRLGPTPTRTTIPTHLHIPHIRCTVSEVPHAVAAVSRGHSFLGNVTGYAPAYSSVDNQGYVLFVPLVHGCGCSGWREMVHVLERVQLDGWLPYIMTLGCSGISRTLLSTLITLT